MTREVKTKLLIRTIRLFFFWLVFCGHQIPVYFSVTGIQSDLLIPLKGSDDSALAVVELVKCKDNSLTTLFLGVADFSPAFLSPHCRLIEKLD